MRSRLGASLTFSLSFAVAGMVGSACVEESSSCTPGSYACYCTGGNCDPGLFCGPTNVCDFDPSQTSGGATTQTGESADDGDDGGTTFGAPVVEQFTVDTKGLVSSQSATFTAIVSDPDGLADVKFGELVVGVDTSAGFFQNVGGGTWTLTVPWAYLELEGVAQNQDLLFRAEFTDQQDRVGTGEVSVLVCASKWALCSGICTDLTTDSNCGSCGNACWSDESCYYGTCEYLGDSSGGFVPP